MLTPLARKRQPRARRAFRLRTASFLATALLAAPVLLISGVSKARAFSGPADAAATAPDATAAVCGGDASCIEVNAFAMSVVEFRASLQGYWKVLTTTLRFRNKLDRPLVLGYVVGSGGATDDRGNRYLVKDSDVRGIGLIGGRADEKFVVAPGQTADARFTLVWNGQAIFGNTFDLDLTVREIVLVGNGQTTLGQEYPLQIVGLVDGARSAGPGVAQAPTSGPGPSTTSTQPAPGGSAPAQTGVASPFGNPAPAAGAHCAAGTSCSDAGSFSVTVAQTSAAASGKNQVVRFGLRVKNHTAQPLVLAYKSGTSAAVDEKGNSFTWGRPGTHDGSALGIGTLEGARIDPQFQIAPNATRDAQVVLTRFDAGSMAAGRSFTLDTVLVEVKALPNGQWQKGREHAVHLPAPGAGAAPAVGQNPPGATPAAGQNPQADQVQKATDLIKGLLGGK